jgi:hypothetical protein
MRDAALVYEAGEVYVAGSHGTEREAIAKATGRHGVDVALKLQVITTLLRQLWLGLQGQVRCVWASRGVKVVQKVQFVFEWTYLFLGVNPLIGDLIWDWIASMRQADLLPMLQTWQVEGVIWD